LVCQWGEKNFGPATDFPIRSQRAGFGGAVGSPDGLPSAGAKSKTRRKKIEQIV